MRGLPGSWDRAIETLRRLRGDQSGISRWSGMTLLAKNASRSTRRSRPFARDSRLQADGSAPEHRPRVGPLLRQRRDISAEPRSQAQPSSTPSRSTGRRSATGCTRCTFSRIATRRSSRKYYETHKSPLPCTALSSSCFIDPYWNLFRARSGTSRSGICASNGFDLRSLWEATARPDLRDAGRRRALLALLDAVRGLSDDSRQSRQSGAADPRGLLTGQAPPRWSRHQREPWSMRRLGDCTIRPSREGSWVRSTTVLASARDKPVRAGR